MRHLPDHCPNCESREQFTRRVESSAPYGPNLLPGLGGFLKFPKFDVVLCSDCGHCAFFADEEACQKVSSISGWRRVGDAD